MFGFEKYAQYTPEYALNMNSFGQFVTYMVAPSKYLAGGGLGSCYIAELVADFGVVAVVAGNLIYGLLIGAASKYKPRSWVQYAFLFNMISILIYAPRSSASDFIASTFNLINIAVVCFVYFWASSGLRGVKKTHDNE